MSLNQVWTILAEHKWETAAIIVLVLSLIQITPIKINPWNWLIKGIRSVFGIKEINEKLGKVETQIEENQKETNAKIGELEDRVNEGQAIQSRVRILRMGDELRLKVPKSRDSFDQVMDDITRYNAYCRAHPEFPNDKTVLTAKVIEEKYQECLKENSFL